jgi:PhnB protein
MQINAYLNFPGTCEEAFAFYQKVLGGKIEGLFRHAGTTMESHVPPEWLQKIMHIRLVIGANEIMGSDAPPPAGEAPAKRFCMSIGLNDPEEAKRIFAALLEGGSIQMPIAPTFWAAQFGMGVDKYGIPWMINCEMPK